MYVGICSIIICIVCPLGDIACHIKQTEIIWTKLGHFHCGSSCVIVITATVGLKVCEETTIRIACIVISPWVHGHGASAACSILPFCLGWQPISLSTSVGGIVEIVSAPIAESMCLLPRYAYHRILKVTRMGEIHMKHRLIKRVLEIAYPGQRVGINTDNLFQIFRLS